MLELDSFAYQKVREHCKNGYIKHAHRIMRTIASPTLRDCAITQINEAQQVKWDTVKGATYGGGI